MTTDDLLRFLRSHHWAVQASVSPSGSPQCALVAYAVSDALELVFDTNGESRKALNLRDDPRISIVIGGWTDGDERTVQCDGVADFPEGDELARVKEVYFAAFPNGRAREKRRGIVYVRVRPSWVRYTDYNQSPPMHEFRFAEPPERSRA